MDNAVHAKGRRGETQRGDYNFASFAHYLRGLCVKTLWCIMYYYRIPPASGSAKCISRKGRKEKRKEEFTTSRTFHSLSPKIHRRNGQGFIAQHRQT